MTALLLVIALWCFTPASANVSSPPSVSPSIEQDREEPVWTSRLRAWCRAVEDHTPGTIDAPVIGINAWSERDLAAVVTDLVALRDLLAKAHANDGAAVGGVTYSDHRFSVSDIEELLGVTRAETGRADFNRLLERGALLHGDIATLVPGEVTPIRTGNAQTLRAQDGRTRGFEGTAHWQVARTLLDAVAPNPSADEFVRSWYRATAALLQRDYKLAFALPHLARAREIFPKDGFLLFASGCLYEAYASPLVQAAVRSADPGVALNVGSATNQLREAEGFFRAALASGSAPPQARLRLGRVIGLLGRHLEAIAELQGAVEAADEPSIRYYGEMFLGAEEYALGHDEAARAHYERATHLYPSAPSPYIALSHIGQRQGDRTAALGAIQQAFAAAADREHLADPWWGYQIAAFRNADDLLASCRREFEAGKKQ